MQLGFGMLLIKPQKAFLLAFCICSFSIFPGKSQTIESLQSELEKLQLNTDYQRDTTYLNKANELGFVLAESNPDSAITFLKEQIKMCRAAKYKKGESEALKIYGNALQNKGDFAGSIRFYQDALEIAESLPQSNLVPGILNNIGLVNFNQGNYAEALVNFYDAIKGAEDTGNLNVKGAALNNIALIYFEQGKLEEAKSKYQEMLEIYRLLGNQGRMILAYNNIGDVELKQNKPLEALENLKLGHESALQLQSPEFIEMTARTLADIYAALDSVDKSESLYRQSIAISKEKGYGVPFSHSTIGLAELYYKKGNLEIASDLANEGLDQAEKMGQIMQLRNANELLTKIHEENGDFEKALSTYKFFKLYNDSINNTQGQRLAATLESEYEFSKKELEFEKANLRQKWLIFSAFFGLLTFLVISFLVYRNRNILNKAYHTLKQKNREIESKNKKLETALDQLKSAQLQLIQSEKMAFLGELTAGIAHEMRNPLNFVNNFSEVSAELLDEIKEVRVKKRRAGNNTEEDEIEDEILDDIKSNLEKIQHHGKRADAIVKGMLAHSGQSSGEKEMVEINALCDEYLRLAYQSFKSKNKNIEITLLTDFDPLIPKIELVRHDIGKVLLNVLNNAFYACIEQKSQLSKSSEKLNNYDPKVSVSTMKLGNGIEILIKDNGIGVADKIKDKIFQPFFTTKPTGQGTGLGLSLSYDIIKAHGGELKVLSKQGEGSDFIIVIPL